MQMDQNGGQMIENNQNQYNIYRHILYIIFLLNQTNKIIYISIMLFFLVGLQTKVNKNLVDKLIHFYNYNDVMVTKKQLR